MEVGLRRLGADDLPTLHRWLNEPGVVRWWEGDDVSYEAVVRDYGPDAPDPVEHWIATLEGRDVAWIQWYRVADLDEEDRAEAAAWWRLGADPATAGIDYLVGDPADRGRGLMTAVVRTFVTEVVLAHADVPQVCASPLVANAASWRALARAGFRPLGDVDSSWGPARLMARDR